MAKYEERPGGSMKTKKPQCWNTEASGNEINFGEEIVMSDISTATSNVIPFKFGKQQVRTLLIDDQPWFVANDVSAALQYSEASAMTRHLDDDEKGLSIVQTLGGDQEMLVINESGLYSAILRSRKAEAKRFKKWVTAEVLPAIRKHGRYEDHGKMATLMDELIGMSELNVIKGLIRDKSKVVPADQRQGFQLVMHNRLHTRFNVPRTELIPAAQFDQACNFIGAYALEGEFIPKQLEASIKLTNELAMKIHHLAHHAALVSHYWHTSIGPALKQVRSDIYPGCNEHLECMDRHRRFLDAELLPNIREYLSPSLMPSYGWGVRPENKAVAA
ncbi:Bro-N domain-containing protein [Pseudomonas sp. 2995-3]|uniref:BRO-N domain-containing protein n=1 Tax=Pseudomonas sp. 2995-3 TaxID=1712680 RepID=UPI002114E61B|nr:Bro-N domain-containing protein [Pseudomonas sp. 2995-3]